MDCDLSHVQEYLQTRFLEVGEGGFLRECFVPSASELLLFSVKGSGWLLQSVDGNRTHSTYVVGIKEEQYWNEALLIQNLCLFRCVGWNFVA
jgi:hypothetical protein